MASTELMIFKEAGTSLYGWKLLVGRGPTPRKNGGRETNLYKSCSAAKILQPNQIAAFSHMISRLLDTHLVGDGTKECHSNESNG